jgi:tight adherence protein B
MVVSGLFLCALGVLGTHWWGLAVGLAPVGACVPIAWALVRRGRRRTACVRQLPDALQTIASALRAGLGFAQGISMVAEHLPPPIAVEFARAQREMTLGLSVEEALQNMSRRVQSLDFDLAVSGILINRQIGGNLAELLDHIIVTLRERVKLKNFIRVQTAQQRLSAWIIVGIGPVLLLILIFAMRDYTRYLLVTSLGHVLLGIALLLQLAGAVIIRRVIAIDV